MVEHQLPKLNTGVRFSVTRSKKRLVDQFACDDFVVSRGVVIQLTSSTPQAFLSAALCQVTTLRDLTEPSFGFDLNFAGRTGVARKMSSLPQ